MNILKHCNHSPSAALGTAVGEAGSDPCNFLGIFVIDLVNVSKRKISLVCEELLATEEQGMMWKGLHQLGIAGEIVWITALHGNSLVS